MFVENDKHYVFTNYKTNCAVYNLRIQNCLLLIKKNPLLETNIILVCIISSCTLHLIINLLASTQ